MRQSRNGVTTGIHDLVKCCCSLKISDDIELVIIGGYEDEAGRVLFRLLGRRIRFRITVNERKKKRTSFRRAWHTRHFSRAVTSFGSLLGVYRALV